MYTCLDDLVAMPKYEFEYLRLPKMYECQGTEL
jgi:hypothetical protein